MSWFRFLGLSLACVAALAVEHAAAAEPAPFHLSYQAPSDCPTEAAWLAELGRRSSRAQLVGAEQAAPSLRVTLRQTARSVEAELVATDVDGRTTRRALVASSCDEAVEGSAWVSALWLDPSATLAEPPEPTEPSPPPAPPSPAPPPPLRAPVPAQPPKAPRDRAPRLLPVEVAAVVQGGRFFTALPESPLGFAGFLQLSAWRASWVRPSLRVGYAAEGSGVAPTARGNVRVSLQSMRAVGCALEWPRRGALRLEPCALFELGRLLGRGEDTSAGTTAHVGWRSLGALARATLKILPQLALEAEAGLVFPFGRERFVFGPDPVVAGYRTPALAGTLALGISIGASVGGPPPSQP